MSHRIELEHQPDAAKALNAMLCQIPAPAMTKYLIDASHITDDAALADSLLDMAAHPCDAVDALMLAASMYMSYTILQVPDHAI